MVWVERQRGWDLSADACERVNGKGGVKAGWIDPPRERTRALDHRHPKP